MRFTLTDNPGLVARASENVGLGLAFLRHVERCRALVYVVDLSSPDPVAALRAVRTELAAYQDLKGSDHSDSHSASLLSRVRGVIANKADMFGESTGNGDDLDSGPRESAAEGQRKLADLIAYVREMEQEEIELGIREKPSAAAGAADGQDGIWVVPVSAKRRENVSAVVHKLAATVREERRLASEREAQIEAEALAEEEARLSGNE
jgi:GTP-binding protein